MRIELNETPKPALWSCNLKKIEFIQHLIKIFNVNKLWIARQAFEKTYFVNCHIDLYKTKTILKEKGLLGTNVYGYVDNFFDNSIVDIFH